MNPIVFTGTKVAEPIQSQPLLFHPLKYVRLCRISEAEAYPPLAFGSTNPFQLATGLILIQRWAEDINLTILRRQQSTVGWPIWNPLAPSASASSRAFRNCVSECCASDSLRVEFPVFLPAAKVYVIVNFYLFKWKSIRWWKWKSALIFWGLHKSSTRNEFLFHFLRINCCFCA